MIDQQSRHIGDGMNSTSLGTGEAGATETPLVGTAPCAARGDEHEAIARAKREWEGTVDALGEIVCLLDSSGQIARANRAVERWGFGKVGHAIGLTPHELLHPGCHAANCALAAPIHQAWKVLCDGKSAEFEHGAVDRTTFWRMVFRPLRRDTTAAQTAAETLAVLVISNVSELRRTRNALETLNASLETRVRARTGELADANRDLRNEVARREAAEQAQRASLAELTRLSEELITTQEHERRRLAVELHDSVGQSLTAVKYSLERAMEMLRRPGSDDPQPVLALAIEGVQQAAESIRTIATNLRPSILDDMGVASAVGWFCRQFAEVYPSLSLRTELLAGDGDIPDRLGTTVFRSVQELLNNVAKHAQATEVAVKLRRDGQHVWIEIRDDGIGMSEGMRDAARRGGRGIRNLRERAELTGGQLTIVPGAPSGTVARIFWRLMNDEAAGKGAPCRSN